MDSLSLKKLSKESKIMLLEALGYASDGIFVLQKNRKKFKDKYLDEPTKVDNMVIFPGSEVILDDNHLSIASYLEEYGDNF